jgi:hypothetical protein
MMSLRALAGLILSDTDGFSRPEAGFQRQYDYSLFSSGVDAKNTPM